MVTGNVHCCSLFLLTGIMFITGGHWVTAGVEVVVVEADRAGPGII
jgi:hypothetical protein